MPITRNRPALSSSNQFGTAFLFCTMALTNDPDIDYTTLKEAPVTTQVPGVISYATSVNGLFITETLPPAPENESEIVLSFAKQLIANSKDIDPNIEEIASKYLWDIL